MKCRFCGTPLPDDARFCSGCGREVERRVDSTQEKNSNEPEDAYYRELDDEEYDEIKKREKEAERLREEAAKERAAREKYAKEEAARRLREEKRIKEETERRLQEEKRAKEEAEQKLQEEQRAKEEAERRLQEEKRAKEEAERKRREEQRVMEESRRQYEEEQRRWRESLKAEEELDKTKQYRGYEIPSGEESKAFSNMGKRGSQQKQQKQQKQRKQQKQQGQSERQNAQQQPTQPSKPPKKKKPMSALAYFIIILVGGFVLYKCGFPEMVINSISKNSSVSKEKDSLEKASKGSKDSKDKKEADKTTADKDKAEATSEEKKRTLADTDNSSMNVGSCLSTDAYDTVIAEDGSFSFGYPKYLFNRSEVNKDGTSYTLSYKEEKALKTAELTVYTESNEGNALENAKQLYQRFSSQVNKIYFKMQPTKIDSSGMARTLIGASVDSSETTGVYIIAANDGKKNYILKFTYPDPDMKDDYNQIDYVVDCVYRYCSFSGGTYRPRTYQQFLKDDMGTKK